MEGAITHEQNVICSKFVIYRSRGGFSANEKEEMIMMSIFQLYKWSSKQTGLILGQKGNGNQF